MKRKVTLLSKYQLNEKREREMMDELKSGIILIENNNFIYCNKKAVEYLLKLPSFKSFGNYEDLLSKLNKNTDAYIRELLLNYLGTSNDNTIEDNNKHSFIDIDLVDLSILQELKIKYINRTEAQSSFAHLGIQSHNTMNDIVFQLEILYSFHEECNQFKFILNEPSSSSLDINCNSKCDIFNHQTFFLSKIVHELKNPLITIHELSHSITDELNQHDTKTIQHNTYLIKTLSTYMLSIAKDMECFSELQIENKLSLMLSSCNINNIVLLVKDIAEGLLIRYHKINKVQFKVNIDKSLPENFFTDEIRFRQIMINLISNAIKFTHEGVISLIMTKEDNTIKITVSDSGIGLSEDQKQNLFFPFEKALVDNAFGAGLGMCIIKELTVLLGSSIQFTSEEGFGSSFWFRIPLCNTHNKLIINKSEYEKVLSDLKEQEMLQLKQSHLNHNTHSHSYNHHQKESLDRSTIDLSMSSESDSNSDITMINLNNDNSDIVNTISMSSSKAITKDNIQSQFRLIYNSNDNKSYHIYQKKKDMHILIADDEPFIRKATIRILTKYGKKHNIFINISEAENGYEILDFLAKSSNKVDLILCDENMPYCTGNECYNHLQNLQNENKINRIPFFLMTGDINASSNIHIIPKPLTLSKFDNLLKLCI